MALYMVIEHFRGGDAVSVYRRFRAQGRIAGEGLKYVSSWVDESFTTCYQLMETDDRSLLEDWMSRWADLNRQPTDYKSVALPLSYIGPRIVN